MNKIDLLITGVGGQGNILASDIVGYVALSAGCDIKKADTLGMAQRGGSVVSHVRIADRVAAPLIQEGAADILLGFEKLESVRWTSYLRPDGIVIINNHALPPLMVSTGAERYPDDNEIMTVLKRRTGRVIFVEGSRRVKQLGNVRTLNVFMLGCLSNFLPFEPDLWQESLTRTLPAGILEINKKAFDLGRRETVDNLR